MAQVGLDMANHKRPLTGSERTDVFCYICDGRARETFRRCCNDCFEPRLTWLSLLDIDEHGLERRPSLDVPVPDTFIDYVMEHDVITGLRIACRKLQRQGAQPQSRT